MPMPLPGMTPSAGIAAPPSAAPPSAGPLAGASPAGANPLAALAGGGQQGGGLPKTAIDLMTFMAGMGASSFAQFVEKLRNPQGKGGPKTALGKEAGANPAMNPQALMALLAQKGGGGMPGGMPGAPAGAPPAVAQSNPLAALGR